jgi:hypothetical protein
MVKGSGNTGNIYEIIKRLQPPESTGPMSVTDWRTAKEPQNIQVFKELFDAEGVDPNLRKAMVLVGDRFMSLEEIIIGHHGLADSNPTELMMEAEQMILRARPAVKAMAGIAGDISKYTVPGTSVLDLNAIEKIPYGTDFLSFLESISGHYKNVVSGEFGVSADDLKISMKARRLINLHGQLEGYSDATMQASRAQVGEVLSASGFARADVRDLTASHTYAAQWMNPEDVAGMWNIKDERLLDILKIASKERLEGTRYKDATLDEMLRADLFREVEPDRAKATRLIRQLNKLRLTNMHRDPIHSPGSAYQAIIFVDEKIRPGYTVFKHWMSAVSVADYDGDTFVATALIQGKDNPEAFRESIKQLIHLKSSGLHAQDEAWMLMDYTMKDYRANLTGGILGMYESADETITREIRDILSMRSDSGVRLQDLLGITIENGTLRPATSDEMLRSQGKAIRTLTDAGASRAELVDLLERGVRGMGDAASTLYGGEGAAAVLSTLFGEDALTKGGFRRLNLSQYIDPESNVIRSIIATNNEAAIKTFTAGKMIGKYVNVVQNNMTMLRRYARDDVILQRLLDRVGRGEGTQAEKIIADVFAPNGTMLSIDDRRILVDMLIPVQEEIEHITIKALKGNEVSLGARNYMDEIMTTIINLDYRDLRGIDYGAKESVARQQILNLYTHTGIGEPYAGMDATLIVKKFKTGALYGDEALTAKMLALFTAFNSMTDAERGVAMEHALGKPPLLPGQAERAVYSVLGDRYDMVPLPGKATSDADLAGYFSYKGVNLSTVLARNIQFVEGMEEIPSLHKYTPGRRYAFTQPDAYVTPALSTAEQFDIATHFTDTADKGDVKVRKIIWEYTPATRDRYGVVQEGATGKLHTGRHLFDPDTVREVIQSRLPEGATVSDEMVKKQIRENISRMTDMEVDPGQKLGTNRKIRIKGWARIWSEAYAVGGEAEATRVFNELVDDIYSEHGLLLAGEPGTGIQNAFVASGEAVPSEVFHIHPESPGLLGIEPTGVAPSYRPVLKLAQDVMDAMMIEAPHIKYAAQRLAHGKYLWEDPYMQRYMLEMDAIPGRRAQKLGMVNWLQYLAHKETPGAFPEFRGTSVSKRTAPAMVTIAVQLGKGPTTSGATLTPFGAILKTGDQVYSNMKFANQEVEGAVELMRLASQLKFEEGGMMVDETGISIDFSKASKVGDEWIAFEAQLKTMLRKLPQKVSPELLTADTYDNLIWKFRPEGIRNLFETVGAKSNINLARKAKASHAVQAAFIQDVFSKLGKAYSILAGGKENFAFSWDVVNTAPVHGNKFISNITKAMVGVTPWEDLDPIERYVFKRRGVSVIIGPDVKTAGFASALADTVYARWMQNYLDAHNWGLELRVIDGEMQVVRGSTGTVVDTGSFVERLKKTRRAVDDILQDILEGTDDRALTNEEAGKILDDFIKAINTDKRLKGVKAQVPVSLGDIYDKRTDTWFLTSNITHMQPTGISRGSVAVAIDQIARIYGTDEADKVLEGILGSVEENMQTRMAALRSAAMARARESYSGSVDTIVRTARASLGIPEDEALKVIYAQEITQPGLVADEPYRVNQKALDSIVDDIKQKNVMLISDDMQQAEVATRAIRTHTDNIVNFVGEGVDLPSGTKVAARTYGLKVGEEIGAWAQQILKDYGLSSTVEAAEEMRGLPGRSAASAVYSIIKEGIPGAEAAIPDVAAMHPMVSEMAGEWLKKSVPFLKSYWKPMAGIAASLVGLGVIHRAQAANFEDAQPEEYVPASQRTRKIPMMRDNTGYGKDPGTARSGIRPQHPGTMQIEPETDIIINEEEYVDKHRLSRMLDRHLR